MTQEKVKAVNKILLDGEPHNITTDEHAGYTGYKPQAVTDAMNNVFWGEWGFEEVSSEIIPGEKGGLAIAQVQVWLKDVEFKPTSWGQNRVTRGDVGDAKKAAQTDAIKKALSYFSIGKRAYHGLLDGKKQPPQPKPAQRQIATPVEAASNGHQEPDTEKRLAQVKTLFQTLYKPDRWEPFKVHHLGMPVSDDGLDLKELDKLYVALMDAKKPAQASVTTGK